LIHETVVTILDEPFQIALLDAEFAKELYGLRLARRARRSAIYVTNFRSGTRSASELRLVLVRLRDPPEIDAGSGAASEGWLGVRDGMRNWLLTAA
jgi:hypothetical protein